MLNVQRLWVLVAVGEEGSFTAAAERLFLSQSAVSQQVAALERETATELVVRGPHGVRLTRQAGCWSPGARRYSTSSRPPSRNCAR